MIILVKKNTKLPLTHTMLLTVLKANPYILFINKKYSIEQKTYKENLKLS